MRRHYVAAFARLQRAHGDARLAIAIAGNARKHHRSSASCHESAVPELRRVARMSGRPLNVNVKLRGRKESAVHHADFAQLGGAPDVAADEVVHVVHDASRGHGARPAHALFRRLKDALELAAELLLVVHEPARHLKPHRCVAVMTASMHEARTFARKAQLVGQVLRIVRLAHKHAVHVAAKRRHRPRATGVKHRHTARVAFGCIQKFLRHAMRERPLHAVGHELLVAPQHFLFVHVGLADRHRQGQPLQVLVDEIRRLKFSPAFFRTLVQMATVCHHVIGVVLFHFRLRCVCQFKSRRETKGGA